MKPAPFMERKKWAINDGPNSPSQSLLNNLCGRDRKPKPMRFCRAHTHHPGHSNQKGSKWVVKRRGLRLLERREEEKKRKEDGKEKAEKTNTH